MSLQNGVRVRVSWSGYVRRRAGQTWFRRRLVRRRSARCVVVRLTSCLTRFELPSGVQSPQAARARSWLSSLSLKMRLKGGECRDVLRSSGGAFGFDDVFERRDRDVDVRKVNGDRARRELVVPVREPGWCEAEVEWAVARDQGHR